MLLGLWSTREVVVVEENNLHIVSDRIVVVRVIDGSDEPVNTGREVQFQFIVEILEVILLSTHNDRELVVGEFLNGKKPLLSVDDVIGGFPSLCVGVMGNDNHFINGLFLKNGQDELTLLAKFPHIRTLKVDTVRGKINVEIVPIVLVILVIRIGKRPEQPIVERKVPVHVDRLRNMVHSGNRLYFV